MLKNIDPVLALHERAERAFAIVQTSELRAWANFLFRKGVSAEELRA